MNGATDDMNPDLTPEEEDAAADSHREQIKVVKQLPASDDPGEIRARQNQIEELERRLQEYEERTAKSASPDSSVITKP